MDIDGVVADFAKAYRDIFNRSAYDDDSFTVEQCCLTVPNFFRLLPVNEKGRELYERLKDDYDIVFLTTPMEGMKECKRDKLTWIRENFGDHNDVLFSAKKHEYVMDDKSILIDDMKHNLDPWVEAGGTAIDFKRNTNDKIVEIINDVFDRKNIDDVQRQLDEMEVNTTPTEKQKEQGNYKKGEITFKSMTIKIENPKGSIRFGVGLDGKKWFQKMKHHYGYILHENEAGDGDKVDCFIGPKLNASKCFVVNQGKDGMFDEHKVMLAFDTIEEAEEAYRANYKKGWDGLMSIKRTNTKQLRDWLNSGNLSEPF